MNPTLDLSAIEKRNLCLHYNKHLPHTSTISFNALFEYYYSTRRDFKPLVDTYMFNKKLTELLERH